MKLPDAKGTAFVLLGAMLWAPVATALEQRVEQDDVSLVMELSTSEMAWSELLELTLTLQTSGERLGTLPKIDERLGEFRVVSRHPKDPDLKADGPRRWVRRYSLEPTQSGELEIPPLTIEAVDASTKPSVSCRYLKRCPKKKAAAVSVVRLETVAQPVRVASLLGASPDIFEPRDIAPPRSLPGAAANNAMLWVVAFGVAAIVVVLLGLLRRRRSESMAHAAPEGADGGHAALDAIDALLRRENLNAEHIERCYEELSGVLRDFIGWRFGFATRPRTSEQTLLALRDADADAHREPAGRLLRACDQVKFAGLNPGASALHAELERARRFVDEAMGSRSTEASMSATEAAPAR